MGGVCACERVLIDVVVVLEGVASGGGRIGERHASSCVSLKPEERRPQLKPRHALRRRSPGRDLFDDRTIFTTNCWLLSLFQHHACPPVHFAECAGLPATYARAFRRQRECTSSTSYRIFTSRPHAPRPAIKRWCLHEQDEA